MSKRKHVDQSGIGTEGMIEDASRRIRYGGIEYEAGVDGGGWDQAGADEIPSHAEVTVNGSE